MSVTTLIPSDLGLPARFEEFRPRQADVACDIAASDKRFQFLDAPTGAGKSLTALTVARLLDARTLYLVGTKGLQSQIVNDFVSLGLTEIKGQSNYKCLAVGIGGELEGLGDPGASCAEGPCKAGIECSLRTGGCAYYDVVRAASKARLVVSNYSYWLTIGRHADPTAIGKFDLLICDEAHSAPEWLTNHCIVNLERTEVRALLSMELPPIDEGVSVWSSWAKEAAILAGERIATYRARVDDLDYRRREGLDRRRLMKDLLRLVSLRRDLDALAQAHAWRSSEGPAQDVRMPGLSTDWVSEVTNEGAKFTPVWGHPYAESYLYRGIPKVVLSSATLMPAITRYLGIPEEESEWHEVASGFDKKRRPVWYLPTTRVDKNMNEGQKRVLANRIDKIVGDRLDRKGIIATVSYTRAREVVERSKLSEFMLTHDSRTTREVVGRFKQAEAPCVLVSPVMVEGFDFPFELCRYIIVMKLPFGDGRDPVEKARRKSDREWANYATSLDLVQTCGRGMRDAEDQCEIFILDDHWAWYRRAVVWPRWFSEAFKQASTVPPPMVLEERKT